MGDVKLRPEEVFDVWAPPSGVWSPWAKPVLFAQTEVAIFGADDPQPPPSGEPDVSWAPSPWQETTAGEAGYREAPAPAERRLASELTAIVLELPGVSSVTTAVALAERGYRPVPLFNGCSGSRAVVPVREILRELRATTERVAALEILPAAPPVFMLDSRRLYGSAKPGDLDNRWRVFPQDFPSGNVLRAHGARRALLVQSTSAVSEDLRHVLLGWKEQGLELLAVDASKASAQPAPLAVDRPRWLHSMRARALMLVGLRRNAAGGFGSHVPVPVQSSGGGHYTGFS